jgi:hypothetical protein
MKFNGTQKEWLECKERLLSEIAEIDRQFNIQLTEEEKNYIKVVTTPLLRRSKDLTITVIEKGPNLVFLSFETEDDEVYSHNYVYGREFKGILKDRSYKVEDLC